VSGEAGAPDTCPQRGPHVPPAPNWIETKGTNEPATFSSGQSWDLVLVAPRPRPDDCATGSWAGDFPITRETYNEHSGKFGVIFWKTGHVGGDCPMVETWEGTPTNPGGFHKAFFADPIAQGDTTRVVWTASSGGKTQTLYKYTVQ
jgi:hypothetical protein